MSKTIGGLICFAAGALIIGLLLRRKKASGGSELSFIFSHTLTVHGQNIMAKIRESQTPFKVIFQPKKANGKPGRIQPGSAKWESSDPEVASIEVDPNNELEATITPGTKYDAATQISAKGDADLDDGADQIREISATGTLELLEDEAMTGDLVFDLPDEIGSGSGEPGAETGV